MANFNLYFASCLMLMTLSWRTSTGLPVRTSSAEKCAQCSLLFRNLLLNITDLLDSQDVLCYGIKKHTMLMNSKSDTVLACAPTANQTSRCMIQSNTSFSESECFRNIMKDLAHYDAAIQSYLNLSHRSVEEIPLLRPTLGIIQSLRKNCSLMPDGETDSSERDAAEPWGNSTFSNRRRMCMMMRGFHTRAITINRALGYINSGDHRK